MEITTVQTPSLGDRSYVLSAGGHAVVVDPQRDIDRVLGVVEDLGVRLTYVLETHNHNDYVTGGFQLARTSGAEYVMAAGEETFFPFEAVVDGDELRVGDVTLTAMHTPGHTPTHLSYVARAADGTSAVFTGGSLLYGSVGRTDLVSRAQAESLTRQQYASAHRLAAALDDDTLVLPTHGFGSFCSSASSDLPSSGVDEQMGVETSTIAEQRRVNVALTTGDVDAFVRLLLEGLDAYPRYYVHMAPRNRVGPDPIDLSPAVEADPATLAQRISAGEWVVDLRSRTAFARDHVTGTVNFEVGDSLVTYLAWLVPWGTPITLVGDTQEDVAEAQRQLVRVGIDRPAAQAIGGVDRFGVGLQRGGYRVVDFAGLAAALGEPDRPIHVLDVRRHDERTREGIAAAQHVPIHELTWRIDEIPADRAIWVHCASGYRASIAASLLMRSGRTPVLVDDDDARLGEFGFDLVRG